MQLIGVGGGGGQRALQAGDGGQGGGAGTLEKVKRRMAYELREGV